MLSPGTKIGPYEIFAAIGAGGMGEVYRARDTRLGRDVAIKVLPPEVATEAGACADSSSEARAVARSIIPNILAVHDIGHMDSGAPYMVTELLEGETLRERVWTTGRCRPDGGRLRAQIARGLAAAHDKQHRPPRSEAREHLRHDRRRREDSRLRPGQTGAGPPTPSTPRPRQTGV